MMASVLPRLSALAPNAVVLNTPPIPPADCLLGAGLRNPNTGLLEPQRWLGASRSSPPQHTERINTVVIRPTQPLSWLDMETDLRSLLSISGDRILRVKGLLMPTDHACSIAVHAVHHQLHVPVALPESMAIKPVLVIVSDGLEEAVLRAAFRRW